MIQEKYSHSSNEFLVHSRNELLNIIIVSVMIEKDFAVVVADAILIECGMAQVAKPPRVCRDPPVGPC